VAGILAAQLDGLDLGATARLATAFALDRLTRLEPGISSPGAVRAAADQVEVHALERSSEDG